jgi:hypothetical protein
MSKKRQEECKKVGKLITNIVPKLKLNLYNENIEM